MNLDVFSRTGYDDDDDDGDGDAAPHVTIHPT